MNQLSHTIFLDEILSIIKCNFLSNYLTDLSLLLSKPELSLILLKCIM